MKSPWLSVPLEDYEAHMNSESVQQLVALADLFDLVLRRCMPESAVILGVAGGNGLERINSDVTRRIVGTDINQAFLDTVRRRFGDMPGIELYCSDLRDANFCLDQQSLVHAALIFEHTGLNQALDNALSLVAPTGHFSVVLQLPSATGQPVAETPYESVRRLKQDFALIDIAEFQRLLSTKRFHLVGQAKRLVPSGKALWLGVFSTVSHLPVDRVRNAHQGPS